MPFLVILLENDFSEMKMLVIALAKIGTVAEILNLSQCKRVEWSFHRYERVPHDLSIVEDPAREIPRRISSHAEKASRSVAAMFNTMSRYLYHKRWIWSVQQGSWPPMSMSVVGRMLSTIAKWVLLFPFLSYNSLSILFG